MIDVHCHLEQPEYEKDRLKVIEKCRKHLRAIITSCAHPRYFDVTLELVNEFKKFIFATVAIHPEYIKEISDIQIDSLIGNIKKNKTNIVGIGETGLDYFWIKEEKWRRKQKELFIKFIKLAKELNFPLIIHSRNVYEDTLEILENEEAKSVVMHMFGANKLTKQVIKNEWYISMNAIVLKSKKHKKVVRDTPIHQLLLETDSPWLAPQDFNVKRNDPTTVKVVAEKIAEIKKISFQEVIEATTENTIRLFQLEI